MTFSHATLLYHISRLVATHWSLFRISFMRNRVRVEKTPDQFIAASLIAIHTWHRPLKLITTLACCFSFQLFTLFTLLLLLLPRQTTRYTDKTDFFFDRKYHIFSIFSFYFRSYIDFSLIPFISKFFSEFLYHYLH